jgi:hypothetical protein
MIGSVDHSPSDARSNGHRTPVRASHQPILHVHRVTRYLFSMSLWPFHEASLYQVLIESKGCANAQLPHYRE